MYALKKEMENGSEMVIMKGSLEECQEFWMKEAEKYAESEGYDEFEEDVEDVEVETDGWWIEKE